MATTRKSIFVLCLFLHVFAVYAADCNLGQFPNEIYISNSIRSEMEIQKYVIDEYPMLTNDLTSPLILYNQYNITSSHFLQGAVCPYYVKVIIDNQSIKFEKWNLQTGQLQNFSISYQMHHPQECRFFSSQQQLIRNAFIFCENATHHRLYEISYLFSTYTYLYLLKQTINIQNANQIVFTRMEFGDYYGFRLIRKNSTGIIHIYQIATYSQPYSVYQFIEQEYDWILSSTQLSSIQFIEYACLRSIKGIIEAFLIKNDGIILRFGGLYYDRWFLHNETIKSILTTFDESTLIIITKSNLYFLSVYPHQKNEYRLVTKELSRIQISTLSYKDAFNIGEFIILADGSNWNVFYLQGQFVKFFKFASQLLEKDIYLNSYSSMRSSFIVGSKHYLLRKPALIVSGDSTRQITLKTSKCTKLLVVKSYSPNKVEVINQKSDLVWRNGQIENIHNFCKGYNVSMSLFTNGIHYNVSRMSVFRPNMAAGLQIINFTMLTPNLLAIVAKKDDNIFLLSCFKQQPCKPAISYNQKNVAMKFVDARLNTIEAQYQTISFKQIILVIVWDVKYYYTIYDVHQTGLQLEGGWQSIRWIFKEFDMIGYYPERRRSSCSKIDSVEIRYVAYSSTKLVFNNWAHASFISNRGGGASTGISERQDILFGQMKICSISNYGMNFLLYEFQNTNLNIKSIQERKGFYIQIGFSTFRNIRSNKVICTSFGLAVANQTQLIFISSDLKINKSLNLSESVENDKISSKFLLHSKTDSMIEVYDLESGLLLNNLQLKMEQIVATKQQSNFIGLRNGTFLTINQPLRVQTVPEGFGLVSCMNSLSSTSKIIKMQIINDLHLPQPSKIQNWATIQVNIWNATVTKLIGTTIDQKQQELTFFKSIEPNLNSFTYEEFKVVFRQINGVILEIWMLNDYCMRQKRRNTYFSNLFVEYGNNRPYYYEWQSEQITYKSDTILGITNYYQNKISILSYNQSLINVFTLQFDKTNYSNVQATHHHCSVNSWIQDDFTINERLFRYGNRVYVLRYQIEMWNSSYEFSHDWTQQYGDLPRRVKSYQPKIQILTLSNDSLCKIQEITSQSLGLIKKINDFIVHVREGHTYLFIITDDQIIIIDEANRAKKFSISLKRQFFKMDVNNDFLLLISSNSQSEVYKIFWDSYPYAGTLMELHTLSQVEDVIIDGVILQKCIVIVSDFSLHLYLLEGKKDLYSIQTLDLNKAKYYIIESISYKNETSVYLSVKYENSMQTQTIIISLEHSLNASQYVKIRVQNKKESKQYIKNSNQQKSKNLSYD